MSLDESMAKIDRMFGPRTLVRLGDDGSLDVEVIPTGALTLDRALGVGGLGRGKIYEVFGPESVGKTTLLYHLLANAQREGGTCAFIDAEHALDPAYAKKLGVDVDDLLVNQPDFGEQALQIAVELADAGDVEVIAIDSVAALVPKAELDGDMMDNSVGLQARMMSQAMRKLAGNLKRTNTLCIFTNQLREKIPTGGKPIWGSPEFQPGGRALKFYASARLDMRRIEAVKQGDEVVGSRVRVKIVKNKLAAPHKKAEFDIDFGRGISHEGCLIDLGLDLQILSRSGSFFKHGTKNIGQGRAGAKAYLRENPEEAAELQQLIEMMGDDDG